MSNAIATDRAKKRLLAALEKGVNVQAACKSAGVARSTAYEWKKADKQFAADWVEAEEKALRKLEARAYEIAIGKNPPVRLLIWMIERQERRVEKGDDSGGGVIAIEGLGEAGGSGAPFIEAEVSE